MNILFVQDSSPCIRNIKYAQALQHNGESVHLLFRHKNPDEGYGMGNEFYSSLHRFTRHYGLIRKIRHLIKEHNIELIHYHNQPDILGAKIIRAKLGLPIVFDCHDFMSFKHSLGFRAKSAERICNEESCGVVYPTARYLQEASQYYKFTPRKLVFGNYFPQKLLLRPDDFVPKLSDNDGKIHVVYQGRLARKKSDHRYIVPQLKQFSPHKYVIHIFPSNPKHFEEYRALPQVRIESKLSYPELIKAMSSMDYGLVMFQDTIAKKLPAIHYAFGNKTFDYLCAGIPILVQDCLVEVRDFVLENQFGTVISKLDQLENQGKHEYQRQVTNVLNKREQFSMEVQIQRLLDFYDICKGECDA